MENEQTVTYLVYEGTMARFERIIKKLWIVVILLIVLLVGSNIAWILYEASYVDAVTIEASQDGDTNIVGGGDVDYGTPDGTNN